MENNDDQWHGEDRRGTVGWTFKREVSVGNILTVIVLAAPLVVWAVNMEKRTSLLETGAMIQQTADLRLETQAQETRREIRAELALINSKVDRILEQRRSGN